jgi:nitrous oxide reductase accessory protein NosL
MVDRVARGGDVGRPQFGKERVGFGSTPARPDHNAAAAVQFTTHDAGGDGERFAEISDLYTEVFDHVLAGGRSPDRRQA